MGAEVARAKNRSISYLKKQAWKACSIYIRKKYADDFGFCTCYTCGIKKQWKDMQAGHGFAGRTKAILFMEEIIRPQCYGCNCCAGGKLDIFTYKLLKEYGREKFETLYKDAHKTQGQWKTWELDEKIAYYQLKGGYNE